MATKTILTISAFSLFLITNSGHLRPWMLMFFAVVEGFVNSFDGPAFTSLFARLTPREDFQQSLAIQSMGFHVSRMLGPTIAGLIIGFKNPAYVFLFDAISYLGVIYMISRAKLRDKESHGPPVQNRGVLGLLDGLKFFFQEPKMRYLQLQLLAGLMIVIPLSNVVFRSFLKEKFHLPASQFGYLFSFPGLGAMVGALYFTLAALKRPSKNLIVGIPALILTLLCVRTVPSPLLAAVLLGFTGFFIYLCVASLTQSMHLATPDDYRGRLGALITLGFNSVSPLMSFPVGVYTDKYGFESSILHLTLVFGGLSLLLAYSNMIENRRII